MMPGFSRCVFGLACCTAAASFLPAESEGRPVYEVFRTAHPIEVDGKLDDSFWRAAPTFRFANNRDGSTTPLKTQAWAGYDDQFIYFAFQIWDDNIWSTLTDRDAHLWTEEAVEVFIQADPSHPSYIELEVNPLGAMLDIFLLDIRKPLPYKSWNSDGLKWAVQAEGSVDGATGDQFWTCEIALPLADVATAPHIPPQAGDRWRLNLYRVERRPSRAGLAWSPTLKPDFHLPDMFGEIVFRDRAPPQRLQGGWRRREGAAYQSRHGSGFNSASLRACRSHPSSTGTS